MRNTLIVLSSLAANACGDNLPVVDAPTNDSSTEDAAIIDTSIEDGTITDSLLVDVPLIDAVPGFTLSSTTIAEGREMSSTYSCFGANISPPLAWTNAPTSTAGFAVFFTDTTSGLIHSGIWDIQNLFSALPENIEKVAQPNNPSGSKQPLGYDLFTHGYLGPCPGSGVDHIYRFTVYAVDQYPLQGVTLQTSRQLVRAKVIERSIAEAYFSVTFMPQ